MGSHKIKEICLRNRILNHDYRLYTHIDAGLFDHGLIPNNQTFIE